MNYDAETWYVTKYEEENIIIDGGKDDGFWGDNSNHNILDIIRMWRDDNDFTWLTRRNIAIAMLIFIELCVVVGLVILTLYRFGVI